MATHRKSKEEMVMEYFQFAPLAEMKVLFNLVKPVVKRRIAEATLGTRATKPVEVREGGTGDPTPRRRVKTTPPSQSPQEPPTDSNLPPSSSHPTSALVQSES